MLQIVSDLSTQTAGMHATLRDQYADMVGRVGDVEGRVKALEVIQDRFDAALFQSRERMDEQVRRLQDELRGAFAGDDPAAHRQRDIAAARAETDAHELRQTVKGHVVSKGTWWVLAAAGLAAWELLRTLMGAR